MAPAYFTAAVIFVLVAGTYLLQAAILVVRLAAYAIIYVVLPLACFAAWLVVLVVAPKRAMAYKRGIATASAGPEPLRDSGHTTAQGNSQRSIEAAERRAAAYLAEGRARAVSSVRTAEQRASFGPSV